MILVGPSGCGKTTTLRMVNRLVEPTGGRILLDGRDVAQGRPAALRRGIGYVIQQTGLFPHRTVEDNIATVPLLNGWRRARARARARELMELVGLDAALARRYPQQLSGFDRGIRRLSFFPADGLDLSLEAVLGEQATVAEALQVAKSAGHHLSSIVQLKPLAASMVFGAPPEFKTRADGQAGLRERYGVAFKGFDALDESGPITLKALMDGQVQAADVFTTTPQILTDHLVSLADPKSDFAAQNVVPLVYRKGANATIVNTLNAISARLTTAACSRWTKRSS